MIRRATLGDVPGIYVLGRRIHMKSDDRDIPLHEQKARLGISSLITDPKGFVLVDEVDGLITGVLAGFSEEFWWSKRRYAVPMIVYAERPGAFPWMLKRFVKWALVQKCAVQVPLDCSFGGKLGAKTVELLRGWMKRQDKLPWLLEETGASFTVRIKP